MNRNIIFIISIISFIGLIFFFSYWQLDRLSGNTCGCPKVISQSSFMIFLILIIIFAITLFYYLYLLSISKKEKTILSNQKTLFSILNEDEKKLINKIIKNKGFIEQKVISKEYGKIKAHRLIQKLKEKNIIKVIKKNNKNKIILNKELDLVL